MALQAGARFPIEFSSDDLLSFISFVVGRSRVLLCCFSKRVWPAMLNRGCQRTTFTRVSTRWHRLFENSERGPRVIVTITALFRSSLIQFPLFFYFFFLINWIILAVWNRITVIWRAFSRGLLFWLLFCKSDSRWWVRFAIQSRVLLYANAVAYCPLRRRSLIHDPVSACSRNCRSGNDNRYLCLEWPFEA